MKARPEERREGAGKGQGQKARGLVTLSPCHLVTLSSAVTLSVLALAFLTASFVARNSDAWFHLATGRLLAQGQYRFGADPFAYTTEGTYWANHSWLFDLALYGGYNLVGGTGLVILKALLVAALAALLLQIRRPGAGAWLRVLEAAALGDYLQARGALRDIRSGLRGGHERLTPQLRAFEAQQERLVAELLSGPPPLLPALTAEYVQQFGDLRAGDRFLRAHQADLCVLEGLLALEQGAPEEARSAFAEAQRLCAQPPTPFAGGPIAGAYLRKLNVTDRCRWRPPSARPSAASPAAAPSSSRAAASRRCRGSCAAPGPSA